MPLNWDSKKTFDTFEEAVRYHQGDKSVIPMNTDELYEKLGISVESYARGFVLADYSGKRGKASYCGRSLEWRRQPVCSDPFATEADAVSAALAEEGTP